MGLKDLLLGKEKLITDKKIGILKARIKNTNPSINHTWTCEVLLPRQQNETVIILEGNADGPFKGQLDSVYSIVDSIEELKEKILLESDIQDTNNINRDGNWLANFYLSAITPIDINENSFEVNFEPIKPNENGYVLFTWKYNQVSDIDIKQ